MRRSDGLRRYLFASCAVLAGCAVQPAAEPEAQKPGTGLLFTEMRGEASKKVRIFVREDFMRIEDLDSAGNYTIFDRKGGMIYEVSSAERVVKVIGPAAASAAPADLEITVSEGEPSRALQDRPAIYYRYSVNGASCYNVVSVADMLEDVRVALAEYRRVLASRYSSQDTSDPCDRALKVHAADRYLEHGFPVREWDEKGYQRFLSDFREGVVPPAGLDRVPADYRRMTSGG